MNINLTKHTIREVLAGYRDDGEGGVSSFKGRLTIRPPYQREFVYQDKQRNAVIRSVQNNLPLNVMYWMRNDYGCFEVLDGQQRTISLGQYVTGDFSIDGRFFHNLTKEEQDQILDYELMIYICEGTDTERLDWFKVINIAGEKLTDQEIRNAVYTGPWLADAKVKFSRSNCVAYLMANDGGTIIPGSPIRQDLLETSLKWISDGNIEEYMANHQHEPNADELLNYFQKVVEWVHRIFPNYRKEMRSVKWGELFNIYNGETYNPNELEERVVSLMVDDDVTKKSGIYPYLLTGDEKHLSIRSFSESMKRGAYERQEGICPVCGEHFEIEGMEADHIDPWHGGGRTVTENCQMLCQKCNRRKSGV